LSIGCARSPHRSASDEGQSEAGRNKLAWGGAFEDSGLVFARENGSAQRPDHVSDHFERLVFKHGLARIRLHDLRHTHATLMLSNGVSPKSSVNASATPASR